MPFDERGWEVPDPTPIARPVGWKEPESLQDMIARLVRGEISRQAAAAGAETFEEADDFDVDDDPELKSPYELDAEAAALPRWKEDEARSEALKLAEARLAASLKSKGAPPAGGGEAPQAPGANPLTEGH